MEESQTAPCNIAPLPVLQKCCPERIELRQGVHEGALTKALLNNTPALERASKFGVLMASFSVPSPSAFA